MQLTHVENDCRNSALVDCNDVNKKIMSLLILNGLVYQVCQSEVLPPGTLKLSIAKPFYIYL